MTQFKINKNLQSGGSRMVSPSHTLVLPTQATSQAPVPTGQSQHSSRPGMHNEFSRRRGGGIPQNQSDGQGWTPGGSAVPGGGMLQVSYNGNHRTYICEVQINNITPNNPVYPFPDLQTLLNKTIIGIEAYSAAQVPLAIQNLGAANYSAAAQTDAFIQLNDATNTALIDRHPVVNFNPQLNNGRIRVLDVRNIVWTNCKLYFATNASLAANTIAFFQIHYLAEDPRFDG